jgi:hypothetical protein
MFFRIINEHSEYKPVDVRCGYWHSCCCKRGCNIHKVLATVPGPGTSLLKDPISEKLIAASWSQKLNALRHLQPNQFKLIELKLSYSHALSISIGKHFVAVLAGRLGRLEDPI